MSTMVERVARAIYEKRNGAGCRPWSIQTKVHKAAYLDDASAAIEAMMEPTEAMLDAVADEEDKRGIPNSVIDALIAEEAWPLMIQAALKEQA